MVISVATTPLTCGGLILDVSLLAVGLVDFLAPATTATLIGRFELLDQST